MTCSVTVSPLQGNPPGRSVRPPRHLPGPEPERGECPSTSVSACTTCPFLLAGLQPRPDFRRWWRVLSRPEVHRDHPRGARVLGLDESVTELAPTELISAILKAPVDLIYNGGIGTYVKASTETNAQVGDKANDALRVNGRTCAPRLLARVVTSASP